MTAPLTPEEREAMLAFLRESLAQAPDASPLHSLRFLLTELDRVTAERDEAQELRGQEVTLLCRERDEGQSLRVSSEASWAAACDQERAYRAAAVADARAWQEKAVELEGLLVAVRDAGPSPELRKLFEYYGYEPRGP